MHARQRDLAEIIASLGRQLLGSDGALYPGQDLYPGSQVFPAAPRTDLRKLSEWIKMMREREELKAKGEVG